MSRPSGVQPRTKLTNESVDALKPAREGSYYVFDSDQRKLAVRVMASGRRFYSVRIFKDGRTSWMNIGEHADAAPATDKSRATGKARKWNPVEARKEADRLIGEVGNGVDPHAAALALRGAPTLREAAVAYVTETRATKKKRESSIDADLRMLGLPELRLAHRSIVDPKATGAKRILDDRIGGMKVTAITRTNVEAFLKTWAATPVRSNRAQALLSSVFNHAHVEPNPAKGGASGIKKRAETPVERDLTGEELARLGQALAAEKDERAVACLRVIFFSGARRGEIVSLEWERRDGCSGFVNFEEAEAVLLTSKTTGPGKKKAVKHVRLPAPALQVLRSIKRRGRFVFEGDAADKPLQNLGAVWARVRDAAGLGGVRIHDLRHAFAGVAVSGGASLPLIGSLLGHTSPSTTAGYARFQVDPLKAVSEKAAATIKAALGKRPKRKRRGAAVLAFAKR